MRLSRMCVLCAALALPLACRTPPEPEPERLANIEVVQQPRWLSVASIQDFARIDRLGEAWDESLTRARRAGQGRRIAAEGALLDPDAGLPWPAPSPGAYRCRMIRIEPNRPRAGSLTTFPEHFCHVGFDGEFLFVTKRTGDIRPNGFLWEDSNPRRLIFLGSLASGEEDAAPAYGEQPERDIAGVFQRIGSLRYRLVMPHFRPELMLDVLELTPAPVQPDE
ncbi:MAG: DUF4893 domain-containing protein [Allosphingosinicella sp.]